MNKREQEHYAAFFEELYETQELLDYIKQQLCESRGFDAGRLFDLLSDHHNSITIQQMRQFLQGRVACNQRELYQLFQRFDWSRSGSISREDFIAEITPFGVAAQGGGNSPNGTVTAQIEGHFISLVLQILKRLRIVDVARKQIKYIQPYDAFTHLDPDRTGIITIPSLRQFLYANDFNVSPRQLYYLLHALRRRCYNMVNLEVFCQNLDPLEFGYYMAYDHYIEEERERSFRERSKLEEESMRRSRIEAQRMQHELQKADRKRQAQIQRQAELEDRVGAQIMLHEEQKERQIRRAMLEEERNMRYNLVSGGEILRQEQVRNARQRQQNAYLNEVRRREEDVNNMLSHSAYLREEALERSRRTIEMERETRLKEAEIERERQLQRSRNVAQEMEASRRRVEEENRRRYEEEAKRIQDSRRRYEDELTRLNEDRRRQQQLHWEEERRLYGQSGRLREEERRRYEAELRQRSAEMTQYEQSSLRHLQQSRKMEEEYRQRIEQLNRRLEYKPIESSAKNAYLSPSQYQPSSQKYDNSRSFESGARVQSSAYKRDELVSNRKPEIPQSQSKYQTAPRRPYDSGGKHLEQTGVPR